jgi:hypothetical protein
MATKFFKESTRSHNRVSKYTGVRWNAEQGNWYSTVLHNGVKYLCGHFNCDREAAKARDIKIVSLGLKKPLQIIKRN